MPDHSSGAAGVPALQHDAQLTASLAAVTRLLMDDTKLPLLERLRLTKELATIRAELAKNPGTLERLKLARRLADVRKQLGAGAGPKPEPTPEPPLGELPEGWSEGPRGMATNPDPVRGGIVDRPLIGGDWFVIANDDDISEGLKSQTFKTRAEAFQALAQAQAGKLNRSPEALQDEAPGTEEVVSGLVERRDTRELYAFDEGRKPAQRKRENDAAELLLQDIEAGRVDAAMLTAEQRQTLAKWSGQGGNLEDLAGTKGSAYEYFTPAPIAEGVWNVLTELGFGGGRVLDPSCGTGVFGAMAPKNAAIEAIDLSPRSARVCQILNDGPGFRTTVSSFEKVAAATPDESFDAVVTNIPFSESVHARGRAALDDEKYQNETMEAYFLKRSMEKLRPGGLAAFLVPTRIVSSKDAKVEALRQAMSLMGEFLGAYRLPSKLFMSAGAEVVTDLIVFRKHGRDAAEKIAELMAQSPATLIEANVLWPEFIGGTYFQGEGRRFVLGEFVAKDPTKFRDVDRVLNDGSAADIGKLMRKLGGSRIDWDKLNTTATEPIVYREGDTMVHAGLTLQMREGRWVSIGRASGSEKADRELADLGSKLGTPLQAVLAGLTFTEAVGYARSMLQADRARELPGWFATFARELLRVAPGDHASAWELGVTGLAVDFVEARHPGVFNYLEAYPELSAEVRRLSGPAKTPPKGLGKLTRDVIRKLPARFNREAGAFSPEWRGEVERSADERSDEQRFEAAKYAAASADGFVPLADVRAALGADFDPMTSDDWCISGNGERIARAGDYYVGNLGEFLARIDAEIAAAPSDEVKAKLMRQRAMARARCRSIDFKRVTFTLTTPFLSEDEKLKFLKGFLDPRFSRELDPESGKVKFVFNGPSKDKSDREKMLARVAYYMNGGSISLGGAEFRDERRALAELRRIISGADTQIDAWAKSHPEVFGRLEREANDPARLYFDSEEDESPLTISGIHADVKPHPYQFAYVRRQGREFNGINAFDVGLGKTLSALLAGQHALAIGSKRKVCYIVPGSVLVNWRKEAIVGRGKPGDDNYRAPAFTPEEAARCLFVGLRERGGKLKTDSGEYDSDLNLVRQNRHTKVFMSYEAFQRMRLRVETAEAYEAHLRDSDDTFAESLMNAENSKKESRIARLAKMLVEDPSKSGSAPFFEDMGFDALFFDEGHKLKNARVPVATKSAKYLSLPEPATVGMDASAKAWFVRRGNSRGDGVSLLTATPLTNSPAEIYSMFSLALGDERLNHMVGARGADAFMDAVCVTEPDDTLTLDGEEKNQDTARKFVGLRNVDILRGVIQQGAVVKTAKDVGMVIKVPKEEGEVSTVNLDESTEETLELFKSAFRFAIDTLNERPDPRGSPEALEAVEAMFGEPAHLIAQPFNLINKMEQAALDPDLVQRVAVFHFASGQEAKAAEVVAEWNRKPPTFVTEYPNRRVTPEMIVKRKEWKTDTGVEHVTLTVKAAAVIEGTTIVLVGNEHKIALDFDELAEKRGLKLDVNIPPKIAALVSNFKNEEANPRGRVASGGETGSEPARRVRQIVFCDHLETHAKLKRVLVKHCGVPSSQIAIVAGKVNGKPEEVQAVQDGFNDDTEGNKYRVIIANEKAEVGINLQFGTQAIHHLSYRGATPDGIQQRNGRAVRQGNQTTYVRVYRYDADGTFDSYKRAIIDSKASWITEVLASDGGNNVSISGRITDAEYMAMIDAGSAGMAEAMARKEQEERLQRAQTSQQRQIVAAETIKSQREWMERNPNASRVACVALADLAFVLQRMGAIERRMADPKLNPDAIAGMQKQLDEQRALAAGLAADLDASIKPTGRSARSMAEGILTRALDKKRVATHDDLVAAAIRWYQYQFREMVEGSPLVNAWERERGVAQRMIEESGTIILNEAKANIGAFTERAHAAVMDGDFAVEGGMLWVRGAVFELKSDRNHMIGVVIGARGVAAMDLNSVYPDTRLSVPMLAAQPPKNITLIQHGQPGWNELVARIAQAEDAYARKINEQGGRIYGGLPSEHLPEVAQQRQEVANTEWSPHDWLLPSPMFPLPVNPKNTDELGAAIAADQSSIIASWDYRVFVAKSNAPLVPRPDNFDTGAVADALLAESRRRGIPIRRDDVNGMGLKPDRFIKADRPAMSEAIQGAASEAELFERAEAWVRGSAVDPAVDVSSWVGGAPVLLGIFAPAELELFSSVRNAIREAARLAEQQRLDAERAQQASEKAARDAESGTVWGWLSGDTYRLQKAWDGGVRTQLDEGGYQAAWKGKNGVKSWDADVVKNAPNAPPNSWITTKAGFEHLMSKFPSECQGARLTFTVAA